MILPPNMHNRRRSCVGLLLLLAAAAAAAGAAAAAAAAAREEANPSGGIKAAYWPSYANATFPASSINFSYFTHVYYAFVQPHPTSFEIIITPFDLHALPAFVALAHEHRVKAMLSFGGAGISIKTTCANLVSSRSTRTAFITSAITVARRYGLDGLDFDWEFPANVDQMSQLGDLFTEWRAAIDREAAACGLPKLLLTSAVYFASALSLEGQPRSYPAKILAGSLDWINAMCYDYHGSWDLTETGAPAALYDPKSNISTSYGVESWIYAGVAPEQVVMGLPLYGHSWQLRYPGDNGIGAPAVAIGPGDEGIMIYSAIVEFNRNNRAARVHDNSTVSAYSYSGTSWIGYDDPESVMTKVEFAKARGLGGYFFWALGFDDQDWSLSTAASGAWSA